MLIRSDAEMMQFGEQLARKFKNAQLIELVGDVGAGKTTLTRGIAKGLDIDEELTSPSFTISKFYAGPKFNLVHYDFYRLADPGLMAEDLAEAISDEHNIVIVEWAQNVQDILPSPHKTIEIKYIDENTRELTEQ